ncbi:homeobox protein MOX-1 isoform X2 [Canis lupus familiaris]|uniref:homeobox protein MOX-1 isoform X2 n=1 Tax=Canis lupus familiaris TaxID=9615 RepID=UPI000DC68D90|nr:homeobox protein MOX-1 isoform X2 [Canis lupus familiaris]XP_038403122.1 homeobox protein MOX-1 isoform X2 [Canis lupus familiaris]XP_038532273.1 homeobox protein MOX-1 isoform X2 [Canis lupus familiaris]XP_048969990.1 homeobox protein MOX-1 isoform X2 [Canis lupus dingo]
MDPVASSCMRSPHPPAPGWGCLRNPHSEGSGASGLPHYPPTPFSFHQKPDFPATATAAYPDFSASCLAATPHSLPREERIFTEQHPAFPQPPDWNFPVSEARRRLNPGPAGGSRGMGASSPGLVDTTGGPGEDYEVLGSTASEMEKKSSRRKKESSGQSVVSEPKDEVEARERGSTYLPQWTGPRGWGLCCLPKFRVRFSMEKERLTETRTQLPSSQSSPQSRLYLLPSLPPQSSLSTSLNDSSTQSSLASLGAMKFPRKFYPALLCLSSLFPKASASRSSHSIIQQPDWTQVNLGNSSRHTAAWGLSAATHPSCYHLPPTPASPPPGLDTTWPFGRGLLGPASDLWKQVLQRKEMTRTPTPLDHPSFLGSVSEALGSLQLSQDPREN